MARKRLSDLLREEAKKAPQESSNPTAGEAEGKTNRASNRAKRTDSESAPEESSEETNAPSPSAASKPEPSLSESAIAEPATDSLRSVAHLEEVIAQLQAQLTNEQQSAQQKYTQLQQEVTQLQAELKQQLDRVKTLELETQQSQQLKTDLEEAKKIILQLSESNQQLKAESRSLAAPQPSVTVAPPPARSPVAKPQDKAQIASLQPLPQPIAPEPGLESNQSQSRPAAGIVPMAGRDRPIHELALRKILDHPTRPGTLPTMSPEKEGKLSETDMGWVD